MSQYELDDATYRDDKYKYCQEFGLQHDCWGSRAAKSFLGLMFQYMGPWKDLERWVLESVLHACQPFEVSHTSENILREVVGILKLYGILLDYCSPTTRDTASNSFNAFDPVSVILQQPWRWRRSGYRCDGRSGPICYNFAKLTWNKAKYIFFIWPVFFNLCLTFFLK